MININVKNSPQTEAVKYILIVGMAFLASVFIAPMSFGISLILFCALVIWILFRVSSQKRVSTFKIQGKEAQVQYTSLIQFRWDSFLLTELSAELQKSGSLRAKSYYVLTIKRENSILFSIDSRDGFEQSKLRVIASAINGAH